MTAAEQPAEPETDLRSESWVTIATSLRSLKAQLAVIEARTAALPPGGFDPDLARAGAQVARAVKDVAGEWRQMERHDRKQTLTPEQRFRELLKYVRTLDRQQRQELIEELQDIETRRIA